jgi:antitoxin (DNA-binding transcriptional repressor) of toxin-antitoxin stability system
MSESIMTVEDAAACLPDLVERIHSRREPTVIIKSGQPMVRIVPIPTPGEVADDLIAFLSRWRREFPEPDEQFAEAVDESRRGVQSPRNPWD